MSAQTDRRRDLILRVAVGENVFHKMQEGLPRMQTAVEGSRDLIVPISFAVANNIVALIPLLFCAQRDRPLYAMGGF